MSGKKCTDCVNCDSVRGFMCTCHYSYNKVDENGHKWHVQCGRDSNIHHANKCEHFTEVSYDRDEAFVL